MNPSRPFILRPVATSLLMAAIFLVGAVAYIQLPVSALPEVDYPTIQVVTFYPGASPDVVSTTVTAPLERQFGQMPGLSQMTSSSSRRHLGRGVAVQPQPEHRRCRAGSAIRHQRFPEPPAVQPARATDLQQDEPRRRAGVDPRRHVQLDPAAAGGGPRGHAAGSQDRAAHRRGPRQHRRRPETGRAHPGQPDGAVVVRHQHGRPAHRVDPEQRQRRQGQFRRAAAGFPDRRQRPARHQRRL